MMFKVGEMYKFRYTWASKERWHFLVKVIRVYKHSVRLRFWNVDGSNYNENGEFHDELHSMEDFTSGKTVVRRLTKLEQALQ